MVLDVGLDLGLARAAANLGLPAAAANLGLPAAAANLGLPAAAANLGLPAAAANLGLPAAAANLGRGLQLPAAAANLGLPAAAANLGLPAAAANLGLPAAGAVVGLGNVVGAVAGGLLQGRATSRASRRMAQAMIQAAHIQVAAMRGIQDAVRHSGEMTSSAIQQAGQMTSGAILQSGQMTSGAILQSGQMTSEAILQVCDGLEHAATRLATALQQALEGNANALQEALHAHATAVSHAVRVLGLNVQQGLEAVQQGLAGVQAVLETGVQNQREGNIHLSAIADAINNLVAARDPDLREQRLVDQSEAIARLQVEAGRLSHDLAESERELQEMNAFWLYHESSLELALAQMQRVINVLKEQLENGLSSCSTKLHDIFTRIRSRGPRDANPIIFTVGAAQQQKFNYSLDGPGPEDFLLVEAYGGGGGGGFSFGGHGCGGAGGYSAALFKPAAGSTLTIELGLGGRRGNHSGQPTERVGSTGGSGCGDVNWACGGGGGGTFVLLEDGSLLVAAGGGGGAVGRLHESCQDTIIQGPIGPLNSINGGAGGGLLGCNSPVLRACSSGPPQIVRTIFSEGGTQTRGGYASGWQIENSCNGGLGQDNAQNKGGNARLGGGGGGGWHGGAAGGHFDSFHGVLSGGGGSGYVNGTMGNVVGFTEAGHNTANQFPYTTFSYSQCRALQVPDDRAMVGMGGSLTRNAVATTYNPQDGGDGMVAIWKLRFGPGGNISGTEVAMIKMLLAGASNVNACNLLKAALTL